MNPTAPAIVLLALTGLAAAQTVVFTNDFESGIPAEVTPGSAFLSSVQGYAGLGQSGNQFFGTFLRSATGNQVRLSLTNLPPHRTISLRFLFAAIDSLDGAGTYPAGDYFKITLDGRPIFREAFANALPTQIQTYTPTAGVTLARRVDLGFTGPGTYYTDSAYDLGADPVFSNFVHSASTAVFTFEIEGAGIQPIDDESWAIDNLRISVAGLPTGSVGSYGISCGPTLTANGVPGIGRALPMTLSGLPANTGLAMCAFGTSNTLFMGAPLPLPLHFINADGCWLLMDAAVVSAYPMAIAGGSATTSVPVPAQQSLIGFELFTQGWLFAPGASPSGLLFSGGLRLIVGI